MNSKDSSKTMNKEQKPKRFTKQKNKKRKFDFYNILINNHLYKKLKPKRIEWVGSRLLHTHNSEPPMVDVPQSSKTLKPNRTNIVQPAKMPEDYMSDDLSSCDSE